MSVLSLRVTGPELKQLRRCQHDAGMQTLSEYLRARLGLDRVASGDNLAEEFCDFAMSEPEKLHLAMAHLSEQVTGIRRDVTRILTPLARPAKPKPITRPHAVDDEFFAVPPSPARAQVVAIRRHREEVREEALPEGFAV
jgi:hypothetical protein